MLRSLEGVSSRRDTWNHGACLECDTNPLKRDPQKSTRATLPKTPGNGYINPELAIYYNQERHPLEDLTHQHSHKNFNLQLVRPTNVLEKRRHKNCKRDQA